MSVSELYCRGARVWLPDGHLVWSAGTILTPPQDGGLVVGREGGGEERVEVGEGDLPPLCNPDILVGANDLTTLSYLHEPAVLHNLQVRFLEYNTIYTYCGIVLVAINPYQPLPIYGSEIVSQYSGRQLGEMDPHVFAVAEEAYRTMAREGTNQSIIVSGESGAGKTVSAKYAMRYFAEVGGASMETQIERKVLASNPIMEAIGNAKTTRNDNSSRFGKYIEIAFDRHHHITGASMRTYLLERSRVVSQATEERNYHIFYQLCASRDEPGMEGFSLGSADQFFYTSQGGEVTVDGVDDRLEFSRMREALHTLGFSDDQQMGVCQVLAAILHIGNIEAVAESDDDACQIDQSDCSLEIAARLLGVDRKALHKWLSNRRIATAKEVYTKPLTSLQATNARDGLAKLLYARLFEWVVSRLNDALGSSGRRQSFIGVLDIYGFEVFRVNSFEQFCINYANEKLQQQFNMHVFKLEQQEYMKEAIEWSFISFHDNQPCIDLIESKLGVLDLLDETCRMPRACDELLIQKLYSSHKDKSAHFVKPRLSTTAFGIRHYAGVVFYEGRGFVDKNVDSVCTEHISLLRTSECKLIAQLFEGSRAPSKPSGPALGRKRNGAITRPTVGSQFRDSLNKLMSTLNSTSPHYIRCIKPNDHKLPFVFDPQRAVQQLRACGVLETIRISAAGFPSRLPYQDFFDRYRMLLPSGQVRRDDVRQMCEYIILRTTQGADKYCFGRTKIFFRAGEVAYLERLRSNKLHSAGVLIQKHVRGWLQRSRYVRFREATILVQARARGLLARRVAECLRQTRAAVRLQAHFRCFVQRRSFLRLRKFTILLQSCYRGQQARQELTRRRQETKATVIQRYVRGWLARVAFRHALRQVVLVQCSMRCWLARRELRKLRLEARSVNHLQNLNHGLEAKIIELQMKLTDKTSVNEELENRCRSLEWQLANAHQAAGERVRELETQLTDSAHSHRQTVGSLEQRVWELEGKLAALGGHEGSVRTLEERVGELEREVEAERERRRCLEEELDKAKQEPQATPSDHHPGGDWGPRPTPTALDSEAPIPSSAKYSDVKERAELQQELVGVRERYQNTLRLYSALEGQFAQLQRDMQGNGKWPLNFELSSLSLTHINGSVLSSPPTRQSPSTNPRVAKLRLATSTPAAPRSFDNDSLDGIVPLVGEKTGAVLTTMKDRIAQLEEDKACLERKLSQGTQHAPRHDTDRSSEQPWKDEGEGGVVSSDQVRSLEKVKSSLVSEVERLKEALQQSSSASVLNLTLQHEVTRLTDENLNLMESLEALQRQTVRVRGGGPMSPRRRLNPCCAASPEKPRPIRFKGYETELKPTDGAIPWRSASLPQILRTLVLELSPDSLQGEQPCLPAHVIFMCLRYPGQAGDQEMADQLMRGVASAIGQVTQNRRSLAYLAFWLANTLQLVNLLWQYSAEDQTRSTASIPSVSITPPPSDQSCSLLAISTSAHLEALTHVATTVYGQVVRIAQAQIQPLVVSGILEHEAIRGLSSSCPIGFRRLGSSEVTVGTIVHELTVIGDTLERSGVNPEIVGLAMKQVFYVIGAYSLNNLLLRKDMCHWSRGMQIRYNLSQLEDWVHTRGLGWAGLVDQLQPVIQAAKLLQMKKSSREDAAAIIELCTHLNPLQVQKILTMYNPVNEYEERVPISVIRLVAQKGRDDQTDPSHLMADVNHWFPMELPYSPASISFQSIAIPPSLLRIESTA